MVVLEAEIARPLAARTAAYAKLRQDVIEIAVAQRIHFMIAVERERALRSQRPFAGRELVAGIGDAEKIRANFRRVSDVINVAEMDRIVRPPGFDERCDLGRFVGAGSPIARERDADLGGVAAQLVDAVISVLAIIGLERMAPTDSKSPIFGHPPPKSVRSEGGEGRISQAPSGFRARARPMWLGMLLLIGDEGRARQLAQILEVFAHAVRPSVARARRLVSARAIDRIRPQPTTAAMSLAPSPLASARANALAAPSIMPAEAPSDWASAAA